MLESLVGLLCSVLIISFGYLQQFFLRRYYGIPLICLPLIYMGFGLFASETGVIRQEVWYGLPFFAMGIICAIAEFRYLGYLVALFWFSHGAYDLVHPKLFVNSGVPSWYPAFCAAIDLCIGLWLCYGLFTDSDSAPTKQPTIKENIK